MICFNRLRNNRPRTEYSFISFDLFNVLLISLFFMIIISPQITMAQTGKISGYVRKYSSTSTGIAGITVSAFDEMNEQQGYDSTDGNGYYLIKDLPPDSYRVCAQGGSTYVTECYESAAQTGCSGKNCGFYWISDPDETEGSFVQVVEGLTTSNVNFYLTRGGNISGDISGAVQDFSYQVILEGDVQYKGKTPVWVEFLLNVDSEDHYHNSSVIPPGDYIIKAQDPALETPYYYTVYYDDASGSHDPDDARHFDFPLDQVRTYTANFTIKKGGVIRGQVLEYYSGQYRGIQEAWVVAKENDLGISRESDTQEIYTDPNTGILYKGLYWITGLPPGSYILSADDSKIPDKDLRIYLPEFYNNVYFENLATPIVITQSALNDPDYEGLVINFILEKGPIVQGWVIDHDPDLCGPEQYTLEKALDGIKVEIIPNFIGVTKSAETDPNGQFFFFRSDKILPGSYNLKARDTSCGYFSSLSDELTITAGSTHNVYFCLEEAPQGAGQMSISGHVFLNEDPNSPLSGIYVGGSNTYDSTYPITTTNAQGEFLLDNLTCGEYEIVANLYPDYFYREMYRDINIWDPIQAEVGENYDIILNERTLIDVFPGEAVTGIDFGLSSYEFTFKKGLNIFGYPGQPIQEYDDSDEFCLELGSNMRSFRYKDPQTGDWYLITSSLEGDPIPLHSGQGYLIYMTNQVGPVYFPPFRVMPPASYQLNRGKNFISYPSSIHRPIRTSSDLLSALGNPAEVASVQSFDNTSGKWKSTVWVWGRPGASNFLIKQGEGYLVEMKTSKTVGADPPNIAP
ncbi:MAG: hypothetical protein ACMUIM_06550 [bacterium]